MALIVNGHKFGAVDTSSPAYEWARKQEKRIKELPNFAVFKIFPDKHCEQITKWTSLEEAKKCENREKNNNQNVMILKKNF